MIITSTPAEIGKRIRDIRRSKEMTQEELGKYLGVTKATINKYEAGGVNFPRNRIEQLSKALNVSPSFLLGWDDDKLAEYVPSKKGRLFDPANFPANGTSDFTDMRSGQVYEIKTSAVSSDIAKHVSPYIDALVPGTVIQANDPIMAELVRIYAELSIKDRNKLLTYAYELEDKKCEQ